MHGKYTRNFSPPVPSQAQKSPGGAQFPPGPTSKQPMERVLTMNELENTTILRRGQRVTAPDLVFSSGRRRGYGVLVDISSDPANTHPCLVQWVTEVDRDGRHYPVSVSSHENPADLEIVA